MFLFSCSSCCSSLFLVILVFLFLVFLISCCCCSYSLILVVFVLLFLLSSCYSSYLVLVAPLLFSVFFSCSRCPCPLVLVLILVFLFLIFPAPVLHFFSFLCFLGEQHGRQLLRLSSETSRYNGGSVLVSCFSKCPQASLVFNAFSVFEVTRLLERDESRFKNSDNEYMRVVVSVMGTVHKFSCADVCRASCASCLRDFFMVRETH